MIYLLKFSIFYAYSDTMVLLDDNVQNPHSQTIKF